MANAASDIVTALAHRAWVVEVHTAMLKINDNPTLSLSRLRDIWLALEALNRPLAFETRKFEDREAGASHVDARLATYGQKNGQKKRADTATVARLCARELSIIIGGGGAGDMLKVIKTLVMLESVIEFAKPVFVWADDI
ncbi:hypothetical protein LTR37_001472 [Vermiconidia calcicola]|uniref:Uncharacterized protein n=1 Tax=Vermiconidia calcicola TaxID=1690605 RepID=A0ACC3NVL7_9PEZI|nr:hypothetical protein LTR37_001472 [Vermiconidia calcicola]